MIFRGEPLALEVLAGNLKGHDVLIVDLKAEPESLIENLTDYKPDIIGITGVTCEANSVLKISKNIKELSKNKIQKPIIVVGGHHASCDPDYFNKPFIDFVVKGLGKLSFRELVDAIENNKKTDRLPGIAKTRQGKKLSFIQRQYSFEDLVDNEPPRYDLVEENRDKYVMGGVGGRAGFVVTAFGCTHRCAFCSIPSMTGGKYLTHSNNSVLRDISLLKDIPLIRFVDANTFGNIKLADELAEIIINNNIQKKIVVDVRADTVVRHPELIKKWQRAGLTTVVIGFEDITDKRLDQLNKKSSARENIEALQILNEIGINVIGDFIISPDYGLGDFERLEAFISEHQISLPIPSILTPIPGTPMHQKMKDKIDIIDLDYYTFSNAVMPTKLEKKIFYETYSGLMKTLHRHITK